MSQAESIGDLASTLPSEKRNGQAPRIALKAGQVCSYNHPEVDRMWGNYVRNTS